MKHLIISIFGLFIAVSISGQAPESKFSLELIYRPTLSFLAQQSSLSPMFGYSTGFQFTINTKNSNGFQTGLLFSKKGYSRKHETQLPDSLKDAFLRDNVNYPVKTKIIWESYYIDVPISYKKSILTTGKANFYIKGGLVANILLTKKIIEINHMNNDFIESKEFSYTPAKVSGYNILKFSGSISCGINFMPSEKIKVLIEPNIEYMINPEPISIEVNSHLVSVGVNIGLILF